MSSKWPAGRIAALLIGVGRIITLTGQIRDVDYVLRLEELRVRADDVARALDLEDGSAAINAKLGSTETFGP